MKPAQIWRRVWNSIAAGTVTQVDDTKSVLRAQLKIGYLEIHDARVVAQQFGFSSVPPIGSDAVVIFVGGDRSNGIVVGTNHQGTRPTGRKAGESSMFNAFGMSIFLSQNGIVIDGGGKPIRFMNGDVHVDGAIVGGYGGADQIGLLTHTHNQAADSRGDTEQPTNPPNAGT